MIHADLHGKNHVAEDVLTSNCIGLLSLLPHVDVLDFFLLARTCRLERLSVKVSPESTIKIDFWPYLRGQKICVPDVLVTVDSAQTRPFKLILEIKDGAQQTGDQLADYWRTGSSLYSDHFEVIYLTHHRSMPREELEDAERRAGTAAKIYWLNWYDLFQWTQRKLSAARVQQGTAEDRIVRTLQHYLAEKGYRSFLEWNPCFPIAEKEPYVHTYFQRPSLDAKCHGFYGRSYGELVINLALAPFYTSR